MQLTILGGGAAWPTARQACGGYLVEHEGYTLLVDPGYAVLPQLLALCPLAAIDAVLVSHGHLDHCADLPAFLAARTACGLTAPLPVLAPRRAVDDVLRAGRSRAIRSALELVTLGDGDTHDLGPFRVEAALLPHHVVNAGFRISTSEHTLCYTGDSGDCLERVTLATGADVLVVEATFADIVPPGERRYLSSAAQAARLALAAGVKHAILTHHEPGIAVEPWLAAARSEGLGSVLAASAGMSVDLGPQPPAGGRRALRQLPPQRLPALPRRAL